MNLKEIFDKAENGTMTYEQLQAAMQEGKAKFVDLSEGNYVDKQKYTDDLAARDTRIVDLGNTIKDREADLSNLKEQLSVAGTDADKLSDLTNSFADLQKKYDKDTKAYEKQLKEQAYKFAVTEFANGKQFTSQAAKRDFINSMLAKNLQIENDTIIGATDFVEAYTKDNADAFVTEQQKEEPKNEPKPHFASSTSPTGTPQGETNPFNFNFTGVRPHAKN